LLRKILADKEILRSISMIGRLGLNIVISLLVFFFIFLYIEKTFNTGYVILAIGIVLGVLSGIYLNYKHLKKFYDEDKNRL